MYTNLDFIRLRCTLIGEMPVYSEENVRKLHEAFPNLVDFVVTNRPLDDASQKPLKENVVEWGCQDMEETVKVSFSSVGMNYEVRPDCNYTRESFTRIATDLWKKLSELQSSFGFLISRAAVAPTCGAPFRNESMRKKLVQFRPSVSFKGKRPKHYNVNMAFEEIEKIGSTSIPVNYVVATSEGNKMEFQGNGRITVLQSLIFQFDINTNPKEGYVVPSHEYEELGKLLPMIADDFIKFVVTDGISDARK